MPVSSQEKGKELPDPADVWGRIKSILEAETAPEIARKLGLTKQSVYEWPKKLPGLDSLLAIARSGNASLHWLLTGEGPKKPGGISDEAILSIFEFEAQKALRDLAEYKHTQLSPLISKLVQAALDAGLHLEREGQGNGEVAELDKLEGLSPLSSSHDLGKQNAAFTKALRGMVQEEVGKAVDKVIIAIDPASVLVQRRGRLTRFKVSQSPPRDRMDALELFPERYPPKGEDLSAHIESLISSLPEDVGLLFHGWDKLSDVEKVDALTQIKELADRAASNEPTGRAK